MNAAEVEEFKQFKAWTESQGRDGYNTPWAKNVKKFELGFKNRKVKFRNEAENTQSAKKKTKSSGWHAHGFFCIQRITRDWWWSFIWISWRPGKSCSHYVR